jgi:hypothetical protein
LFKKFQRAQLKLNSEKSQLFQNDVRYLGLILLSEGVIVDPEKLKDVQEWPLPKIEECPSSLHLLSEVHIWIRGYGQALTQLKEEQRNLQSPADGEAASHFWKMSLLSGFWFC